MRKKFCFRCENELIITEKYDDITFYECTKCNRNYAKAKGKSLTDRWGSAISIALYSIIFAKQKIAAEEIKKDAIEFYERYNKQELKVLIQDIDDEINKPKQKLVDILDLKGTEEIARDFLSQLSIEIKKLQRS